MKKEHAGLDTALSATAEAKGFAYALDVRHEKTDPALLTDADPDGRRPLVVLPLERGDHASEGHVRDRVRHSANPLLVVPHGDPN